MSGNTSLSGWEASDDQGRKIKDREEARGGCDQHAPTAAGGGGTLIKNCFMGVPRAGGAGTRRTEPVQHPAGLGAIDHAHHQVVSVKMDMRAGRWTVTL